METAPRLTGSRPFVFALLFAVVIAGAAVVMHAMTNSFQHQIILRHWEQLGLPTGAVVTNDSTISAAGGFDLNGYCENHLYFQDSATTPREKLDQNSNTITYQASWNGRSTAGPISLKNAQLSRDGAGLLTLAVDHYVFKRYKNGWYQEPPVK